MAAPGTRRMVARRPFQYDHLDLDFGQVFDAHGAKNDASLERHAFMVPFKRGTELFKCDECGAEFWGELERRGHYEKRHVARNLNPQEEDAAREREMQRLNRIAPLHIEQAPARL